MSPREKHFYEFGPFRVDVNSRMLMRDDQMVPLTPKAFDTLLALVECRGELVERKELIKAVWPDVHVEEGNLNSHICMLRRVLGDDAGEHYIVTVPRRGYRFIAEVRARQTTGGHPRSAIQSLAVLPFYLQGRFLWNQRTAEALKQAIEYFELATAIDPDYAPAYAGLAESYALLGCVHGVSRPREAMPRAKTAALRALELDAQLVEAHAVLSLVQALYEWDWRQAQASFEHALELDSTHITARHWHGLYLAWMGRSEDAIAELRRAAQLEPFSPIISANIGWAFYAARRYDDAIDQCRKTIEMQPNFYRAHIYLGCALAETGAFDDAIAELELAARLSGSGPEATSLGYVLARAGRCDEARGLIRELRERAASQYVSPYAIALIHAGLNQPDEAIAWLERALEDRTHWLAFLKVEPKFDGLRDDSRFHHLLDRIGLTCQTQKVIVAASGALI